MRTGILSTVTAAFRLPRFNAKVSLEYSGTFDKGIEGRNVVSPSADLHFLISDGFDITAFGRRAYRVPTFNELYYPGYGNPDLLCEDAWLSTLGAHWRKSISGWSLETGADAFYNTLKNKIVSAPSAEDPSLWFPYNVGRAIMYGADVKARAGFKGDRWDASISVSYTWQNAKDKTPDSASYDEQLPYIAKHSLSNALKGSYKGWSLDLTWNVRCGRRDSYGVMPDYNTLDITAGKDFPFKGGRSFGLKLIARNITNTQYVLSSGYPMPGRALYGGIDFKF